MEAEKSLHLQSGKPVFQFKFEGEEKSQSQSQAARQDRLPLTWGTASLLELGRPSTDWIRPTHSGRGAPCSTLSMS